MTDAETITRREQLAALRRVSLYRPILTIGAIFLSILAALLEGIGLSFLIPVIEITQGNTTRATLSDVGRVFLDVYGFLGFPFTLETVIGGVGVVVTARYVSSFAVSWVRAAIETDYIRHLQTEAFSRALAAQIAYYDSQGSDRILNAIVTQAEYAGKVLYDIIRFVEQGSLCLIYLGIAIYISPVVTAISAVMLGGLVFVMQWVIESGYTVGDRIATANEQIQESVQAGTQGIRDVKLFGLSEEILTSFRASVNQFYAATVRKQRNEAAMQKIYQMVTALTVFVLIYIAVQFIDISTASLGVFLFAMFRLSPRVSNLNNLVYRTAGNLPHLVRTQKFIDELDAAREGGDGDRSIQSPIETITVDDVSFSYGDEQVLADISFSASSGEFVAFVGPSGAGKSTIISLLTRLYSPDEGEIRADGTAIDRFDIDTWRERVSAVRQQPFIFNDTLRYNVTVGNRDAMDEEISRVCELAEVTEFIDELPKGMDTELGDDGVRLSGGQRQRIAIARALLKDGDILILDEATSDLDTSLEEAIQANLEGTERDRILIVIAHRLSTIVNADTIYVIEDGKIAESGPHEKLVDQQGTYAELYSSQ